MNVLNVRLCAFQLVYRRRYRHCRCMSCCPLRFINEIKRRKKKKEENSCIDDVPTSCSKHYTQSDW